MKNRILSTMQRIGKSFMLPIAILPIAGLLQGIAIALTNQSMIEAYQLESVLGEGTLIYSFMLILKNVASAIFDDLPLIFAAGVSLGMAKKEKGVAVLSAVIAFFVMHTTINSMLMIDGQLLSDGTVSSDVIQGTITSMCGIQTLEMGAFGGILVGLGVSFLHNRYYKIEFPDVFSFFGGTRFVPIISTLVFIIVGIIMFYIWPIIQNSIYSLGHFITGTGYIGTFIFGIIKRCLVPFGLHHLFYLPFWQTAVGGTMVVDGTIVQGAQNIFFAQMTDPNLVHYSVEATRYFTGEFIFMIFGLPGAALAMYQTAKPENKKAIGSLLFSAALTSILTGITEPIEFTFLFAAPLLFGVQVILAGSAYMVAHIFNIAVGLTFSGGLFDFIVFGVLQGNSKTSWVLLIPIGIIYFMLYYFSFKYLIKKFDLKTPGREIDNMKLSIFKNPKASHRKLLNKGIEIDKQSQLIVRGLGGRDNFTDLDCCITRLRATVSDNQLVNEGLLKQSGAAAVVMQGNGVQIIYGPKASSIKSKLDEYLINIPDELDDYQLEKETDHTNLELGNIVDGEVLPIEQAPDQIFSHKLLGDGVMIKPFHGLIVAPCDGEITMIYPTKHAIGMKLDNGYELLIHFGTDTVNLNGTGFEILVKLNQRVQKGDLIWNADLEYIKENALDESILLIFTNLSNDLKIEKEYGKIKSGSTIMKICN